jgi:hypothetical protein
VEEPLFVAVELDSQAASLSFGDVDGGALSGAHLVEHGLSGYAERLRRLVELDVAIGDIGHEPLPDLLCEAKSSPAIGLQHRVAQLAWSADQADPVGQGVDNMSSAAVDCSTTEPRSSNGRPVQPGMRSKTVTDLPSS